MATSNSPKGLIPPLGDAAEVHAQHTSLGHGSLTPNEFTTHGPSYFDVLSSQVERTNADIDPLVKKLVEIKQREYAEKAAKFKLAHYISLSLGAGLGIVTPFLIPGQPIIAQITSVSVVFVISFDQIFKPKEKWSLYSKATDLLQLQIFQKNRNL